MHCLLVPCPPGGWLPAPIKCVLARAPARQPWLASCCLSLHNQICVPLRSSFAHHSCLNCSNNCRACRSARETWRPRCPTLCRWVVVPEESNWFGSWLRMCGSLRPAKRPHTAAWFEGVFRVTVCSKKPPVISQQGCIGPPCRHNSYSAHTAPHADLRVCAGGPLPARHATLPRAWPDGGPAGEGSLVHVAAQNYLKTTHMPSFKMDGGIFPAPASLRSPFCCTCAGAAGCGCSRHPAGRWQVRGQHLLAGRNGARHDILHR